MAGNSKGFTFTASMLILSITLVAMAAFAFEWRNSQQASFSALSPSDNIRVQERISADFYQMLGVSAKAEQQGAQDVVKVGGQFPFKKEGAPLADASEYANSLPYIFRNSGFEAVVAASGIDGSSADVITVANGASVSLSNAGATDTVAYSHPAGRAPSDVYVTIYCDKEGATAGNPVVNGNQSNPSGPTYHLNFTDAGNANFSFDNTSVQGGSLSFAAHYPDGSVFSFGSDFSGEGSNTTSFSYSKSPGAALVLPFDADPPTVHSVTDYSPYSNDFTEGDGIPSHIPMWMGTGCKYLGCFSFNGQGQLLVGGNVSITDSMQYFSEEEERIANGGFESYNGTQNDDVTDTFAGWEIHNTDGDNMIFDSSMVSHNGTNALSIWNKVPGPAGDDYASQTVTGLLWNSWLHLSFWAGGSTVRYRLFEPSSSRYLQADGTWEPSQYNFSSGIPIPYSNIVREFRLPENASSVSVQLLFATTTAQGGFVDTTNTAVFDDVSLKSMNKVAGDFESYYNDTLR